MDLIVWYDPIGEIDGFQLCYDKQHEEKALTWSSECGLLHDQVDDGENRPGRYKSAPILTRDGEIPFTHVLEAFQTLSEDLDPQVRQFVNARLEQG